MTLNDLTNLMLSWLDDPNAGYFTPAVTLPFLNNAQQEVAKKLVLAGQNYYIKSQQTTLVVNQGLYQLPSDFLHIHRLEVVTDGCYPDETRLVIAPITMNQQDYTPNLTGTPESYFLKRNCLVLTPVPDTAYPLRINYSYQVANMVNLTDVPDVPSEYHEFIAVLATLDGNLKDKMDLSGVIAKRDYYEKLMNQAAAERKYDQPRCVVVTEDDGFGQMF